MRRGPDDSDDPRKCKRATPARRPDKRARVQAKAHRSTRVPPQIPDPSIPRHRTGGAHVVSNHECVTSDAASGRGCAGSTRPCTRFTRFRRRVHFRRSSSRNLSAPRKMDLATSECAQDGKFRERGIHLDLHQTSVEVTTASVIVFATCRTQNAATAKR